MKKIAIVIINFNCEKHTLDCLESLLNLEHDDYELLVIVVDNGSDKKFTIYNLQFTIGELKIIRSEENLGFSGGNNLGIKYALEKDADYVLILNNDTIVEKNLVKELLNPFALDEKIGITVPKIYFEKGYEFHKDRYKKEELGKIIWYAGGNIDWNNVIADHKGVDEVDHGQFDKEKETAYATGCAMMVKNEVFKKVCLLNEKYFLYYEDNDFSWRVKKAGYKIIYVPKAILWHKNAGSTGGSGSELQDYYITRNRLYFGLKYAPFKSKLALIKESVFLFLHGRKFQKRGVVDFYLRRLGKGRYG